jgi:hypothetical protein
LKFFQFCLQKRRSNRLFVVYFLEIGIWILPFDSFDFEALGRLSMGYESLVIAVSRYPRAITLYK